MKPFQTHILHIGRPKLLLSLNAVLLITGLAPASQSDSRERDRLALKKVTNDMIEAFDKRDAAAIAAHWIDEGEFIHNDDEPIRGQARIERGYVEFFKTLNGHPKLQIQSDVLRFPSADMAVSETTLRLEDEEGEVVASGRQNTILVREGGQWKIAIVREWDRDTALDVNLSELEWLIGSWNATTKEREVTITYKWDENRTFLRGEFIVKKGPKVIESGTQIIGKDNVKGVIRSWVFQSDGGFGDEIWAREGRSWSVEVHGVGADGKVLRGTNIYIHVDPDAFTWQAVGQTFDGVSIPGTEPIKVTRQTSAK